MTDIHKIDLGFDQCYVLKAEGVIAVDAGAPKKLPAFLRGLARAGITPEEVKLVVLTHGHWDHIGSARDIKGATGAKLALHASEAAWLENSLTPLSPGVTRWGRIFTYLHGYFMPLIHVPAVKTDIRLGNNDFPLYDYGIPGKVVHTPGHSTGSCSVLLDSGEAFVGDLAMNKVPLRLSPGLPIFAEDMALVTDSWKHLLTAGAKVIYPAHGKPFSSEIIRKQISR